MRLFPESEKWVCTSLIRPTTNEIRTNKINVINQYIRTYTKKGLEDYTFDEFVNLLNSILSGQQVEIEETRKFKEEIISNSFTGMFSIPYINDWDLCGLILIIKRMMDENLTTCENPISFISETINLLNPVNYILDEEFDLLPSYFPKNFTYSKIENDEFMNGFFENVLFEFGSITITDIINKEEYSFLLLNENFKCRIYSAIDEDIFNELFDNFQVDENFIRTLLKYQPLALRLVGDRWSNNKEIVILAVSNDGMALEFAPTEFKSDREIVILALKNNPKSLIFASYEIIVAAANSIIDCIDSNRTFLFD
jgi:hypothetical protein